MEKIFDGKSMFGDPFAICRSEDGEYWLHKPMDDSDPSMQFSKETAEKMAVSILKAMGHAIVVISDYD